MIKPACDVAARCKPGHYVWRELPVRTVVVVRRVNDLLHCWPHVIGKLRRFDHDPGVFAEPGKPVRGAYYVIFSDGRVKDSAWPKLLLHSLGRVKDAALLFRRNVLAPQEGVRVATELG